MNKILYIMQGVPGSGKSCLARMIQSSYTEADCVIFSTDEYWSYADQYRFDERNLRWAHQWNQRRVAQKMLKDLSTDSFIIVDNTNILGSEALPYRMLAEMFEYTVQVVSVDCGLDEAIRRNAERKEDRQVPEEVIRERYSKMERLMT